MLPRRNPGWLLLLGAQILRLTSQVTLIALNSLLANTLPKMAPLSLDPNRGSSDPDASMYLPAYSMGITIELLLSQGKPSSQTHSPILPLAACVSVGAMR